MENGLNTIKPGEWVILRGDEIIEHDSSAEIIMELALKYRPEEIIITKEPTADYCFY